MTVTRRSGVTGGRWLATLAAATLLLALIPLALPAQAAHPVGDIRRLGGQERLETATLLARDGFPNGAQTAILARADIFPDALAGSHIAGARDAPILLTPGNRVPETTTAALRQLNVRNVVLLGGTAAISEAAANQLRGAYNVQRVGGLTRYDTARIIAETVAQVGTMSGNAAPHAPKRTAILASAANFADALASGPLSFAGRHPILLTDRTRLNNETRRALTNPALNIQQVLIAGGNAAVSAEVEAVVQGLGIETFRVRGAERTETARNLADLTIRHLGWQLNDHGPQPRRNQVNLARGNLFPDALALGPRAAKHESVILLSQTPTVLGAASRDFLRTNCAELRTIVVAGGTAAVSNAVADEASALAKCADFAATLALAPRASVNRPNENHTVTATGTNLAGEPAAGAVVRFELYREVMAQPPAGTRFYQEGSRFFVFVREETATANAQGQAPFTYTHTAEDEDRIVACAPPAAARVPMAQAPTCVDDTGAIRPNTPYGSDVAAKLWRVGTHSFTLAMSAQNEVNAQGGRPDPDPAPTGATGHAELVFNAATNEVCWALAVDRGTSTGSFTGPPAPSPSSHIHVGGPNTAGGVVVPLSSVSDATGFTTGCTTNAGVAAVLANPAGYYVNVHNNDFPAGLVRGQLPAAPN